jgi:hypothetical protein
MELTRYPSAAPEYRSWWNMRVRCLDPRYGCRNGFAWVEPCSGEQLDLHYTTPPDGWMPLPTPPTGGERG